MKINSPIDALSVSKQANGDVEKMKELAKRGIKTEDKNSVEYAAGQFESLMVNQLLKEMTASVKSEGLFGEDSNEQKIFQDMFNQELSDEIVKGKGIGIKEYLSKQLRKYSPD